MHQYYEGVDLLSAPEPPEPEPRVPRRSVRRRRFVAALVAGAVVLLCANGAVAYYGYRISLDEQIESVEPGR